ncbi:FAD-binding oxidoreductase [Streptomyces sp. URMC 126]|uniref:FAD-binding oxidoreductase n=1 Tax=Streptomyces sp. URMC 126 TaxID=3423401 RepID=UPI003F1D4D3E
MSADVRRTLEAACPGRVVTAEHPAYDRVRLLFNGVHDRRPAAVCLPRDTAGVRAAVLAAQETGLPTTVRGGGHNIAGAGSVDGGVVIDLRSLNGVRVDPGARTARVGGGATWAQVDLATDTYRMATTGGTFDDTGVGGLTLGGGIGHLMGRAGLSCDNVLSYELVTASGETLRVSPETYPEIDWALRGAGHHFGAVTEFTFRLHDVPSVYGGYVAYPGDDPAAVVRLFRDLMRDAPDELVCTLLLERYGPMQEPAGVLSVCYSGADPAYPAVLDKALRADLTPVAWNIGERSYVSVQQCLGRLPFGLRHYWSARCVDGLPDELAEAVAERFRAARVTDPYNDTILIEPIHGAVRDGARVPGVVPFRNARFNITGMAIWDAGLSAADDQQRAWAHSVSRLAEPYSAWGEGYLNYAGQEDLTAARGERTYGPENFARLCRLKRRLDPDGVFRSGYTLTGASR